MSDRCVSCGAVIPEGRMVCIGCEENSVITFGERLKKLREKRSMSQFKLSLKAEISQCVISWYETNKVQPTLYNIERLCKALNVSATELLGF